MVKKLLRHEFVYYFRTFSIFLPIVLAIGIMTRILLFFDNGNPISNILIGSSYLMLFLACVALVLLGGVIGVVRFYKNLYTAEGYLSFTLPVTNTQHILTKLLAAMVCEAVCVLTVIATVAITLTGAQWQGLFESLRVTFQTMWTGVGGNLIGYIIELLLAAVLSSASAMLLIYACITVGQMAKKNRILMAFVAYFVYYMATQLLSTILTVFFYQFSTTDAMNALLEWMVYNLPTALHLYFGGNALISAGLSVLFFFVTKRIMTKKLNLE